MAPLPPDPCCLCSTPEPVYLGQEFVHDSQPLCMVQRPENGARHTSVKDSKSLGTLIFIIRQEETRNHSVSGYSVACLSRWLYCSIIRFSLSMRSLSSATSHHSSFFIPKFPTPLFGGPGSLVISTLYATSHRALINPHAAHSSESLPTLRLWPRLPWTRPGCFQLECNRKMASQGNHHNAGLTYFNKCLVCLYTVSALLGLLSLLLLVTASNPAAPSRTPTSLKDVHVPLHGKCNRASSYFLMGSWIWRRQLSPSSS